MWGTGLALDAPGDEASEQVLPERLRGLQSQAYLRDGP